MSTESIMDKGGFKELTFLLMEKKKPWDLQNPLFYFLSHAIL